MFETNVKNVEYLKRLFPKFSEKLSSYSVSEVTGVLILSDSSGDPMNSIEIYPTVMEDEVKKTESKLGYTLHSEFRDLLLHFNGGRFFQDFNIWGLKKAYSKKDGLEQYYDLVEKQNEYKMGWAYRTWKDKDLIVGSDGGGNLVVLNNENGKVTYLDTEYPDDIIEDEFDSISKYFDEYLVEYLNNVIG